MPHDNTVQEAVSRIALEHRVSRSQARRMLIETLDLARRQELREKKGRSIEIDNYGKITRGIGKTIHLHNPSRRHVSTDTVSSPPVKSADLPDSPRKIHRGWSKSPTPGSLSAIIYGELTNPDNDFTQAFVSLRGMGTRFDHLDDHTLKQRMWAVAWRFDIPLQPGSQPISEPLES